MLTPETSAVAVGDRRRGHITGKSRLENDWLWSASISHAVCMIKTTKVVPLAEAKQRLIARDSKAQRIIVGIGSQRIAIDFFSHVTKLPPHTGDQPAVVLPIRQSKTKKKAGKTGRLTS